MRRYSIYYAPKTVTTLDSSTDPIWSKKGTSFFGIRVQDLLLKKGNFYKECAFFALSEVTTWIPPDQPIVTSLIMSNTKDAQRIAVVPRVDF